MIVKHKGDLHHAIQTPLGMVIGDKWKPDPPAAEADYGDSKAAISFPKIPYRLFCLVAKWQTEIAAQHRCESATSLFLVNGEWVAVPFYQENNAGSMTIDIDFRSELNAPIEEHYAAQSHMGMHATLHNHVSAGAGQSGRDSNDEKNLFGPHITIGNLDKAEMSFHARLSVHIDGKHKFIELGFLDIIESPLPTEGLSVAEKERLSKTLLTFKRSAVPDYPAEWKDRFALKVFTPAQSQSTMFHFGQSQAGTSGATGETTGGRKFVASVGDALLLFPSQVIFHDFDEDYDKWQKMLASAATSEILKEAAVAICLEKRLSLEQLHQLLLDLTVQAHQQEQQYLNDPAY